jgi:Putative MetA-pathway of phenol degradation
MERVIIHRLVIAIACLWIVAVFHIAHGAEVKQQTPIEGIADNSFLVEEAYNQEPGVVQHIFTAQYGKNQDQKPKVRGWSLAFTQEWPVFSQDHQFSYTLPFSFFHQGSTRGDGVEDILVNYRYQALDEEGGFPAFAPRFSLILPTGSRDRGKGYGVLGYEFNLPLSKKMGDRVAVHLNYGLNYFPRARARLDDGSLSRRRSLVSYSLGASAIYALSARLHLMLEWAGSFAETIDGAGRTHSDFSAVLSPGLRGAVLNTENKQLVLGLAVPVGLNRRADNYGILIYFSFEHRLLEP